MTKIEAEELFIDSVVNDKTTVVEMSLKETLTFRVLVGRILKDMDKNRNPILKYAKNFIIERKGDKTIITKKDSNKYKAYYLEADGTMTPKVKVDDFGAIE